MHKFCVTYPFSRASIAHQLRAQLLYILASLAMIMNLGATLKAQTPPTPQDLQSNREEIRRRQQQEQAEQEQRLEQPRVNLEGETQTQVQIPLAKPDADGIYTDEEHGFLINKVEINSGNYTYPWLRPIAKKFEGKKLGMPGIQQAIKLLTNTFIERGYVTTRVLLPEQDIAGTHTLKLIVATGLVSKVTIAPGSSKWGSTWWNAFPTHPGKVLNLRDIEQGLEQMKRVSTQDVTMDLKPGAQGNESEVVVTRKNKFPLRGNLNIDNSGDKNTGKWQGSATGFWDAPLLLNDLLSFTYNGAVATASGQGTRGDNITYSIPLGYFTANASYNTYTYHQTVQGYYNPYESSGTSRSWEGRLQWLAYRDQNTKTTLQARLTHRANRNYIDNTELEVQRRDTTALELALQNQLNIGRTLLDTSIAYRIGVPWLEGSDDPKNLPPEAPTYNYRIMTADATLRTGFAIGTLQFGYQTSLRAQLTGNTLYGSEYFSIGNRYTVRGFDGQQTLGAEKGITLRNDLSIPLFRTNQTLYLALDGGYVTGHGDRYNSGSTLTGGALGLRGGWKWIYYDATLGCPLYKPHGMHTERITYTAQAGVQF